MSDDLDKGRIFEGSLNNIMEKNPNIYRGGSRKPANRIQWETIDFNKVTSINEVAEKLQVQHATVQSYCRRHGINLPFIGMTPREKGLAKTDWEEAKEWWISNSQKYWDEFGDLEAELKIEYSPFIRQLRLDLYNAGFKKIHDKRLFKEASSWIESDLKLRSAIVAAEYYGDNVFDHM